jgi:CheY-like chemotaxis protein
MEKIRVIIADDHAVVREGTRHILEQENDLEVVGEARDGAEAVTLAETPAVADVDGDGTGEILGSSNSGLLGLTVTAGANGDWPWSRPTYNQYTYYGANIGDDLSVPLYQEPPWIAAPNIFRGQPSAVFSSAVPNLTAAITGVCAASCDPGGLVKIAFQVTNTGMAPGSALVSIYGNPGGVLTEITTFSSGTISGASSFEDIVETTAEKIGTELVIVVDEDESLTECHEDDNTSTYTDLPCP